MSRNLYFACGVTSIVLDFTELFVSLQSAASLIIAGIFAHEKNKIKNPI